MRSHPESLSIYLNILQRKAIRYEPAHDKTYNKTCATSKDLDQHVHATSMASVEVKSGLCIEAV